MNKSRSLQQLERIPSHSLHLHAHLYTPTQWLSADALHYFAYVTVTHQTHFVRWRENGHRLKRIQIEVFFLSFCFEKKKTTTTKWNGKIWKSFFYDFHLTVEFQPLKSQICLLITKRWKQKCSLVRRPRGVSSREYLPSCDPFLATGHFDLSQKIKMHLITFGAFFSSSSESFAFHKIKYNGHAQKNLRN